MKLFFIALSFFLILGISSYSQNVTSRLRIESGGSIYFNFNSLEKYQTGLEYTNWTKVSVYYIDTTDTGIPNASNWKLTVKAMSPTINGDAGNTLPLNTIEMQATGINAIYYGPFELTNIDNPLADTGLQTAPGVTNVYITYFCGKSKTVPNSLLGKMPDYYYIDILLTLQQQ